MKILYSTLSIAVGVALAGLVLALSGCTIDTTPPVAPAPAPQPRPNWSVNVNVPGVRPYYPAPVYYPRPYVVPAPVYYPRPAPCPYQPCPYHPHRATTSRAAASLVSLKANEQDSFMVALNRYRQSRGVKALAWDQQLADWAAINNRRGGGHRYVPIGCAQNWASTSDAMESLEMWKRSRGHNANLLRRDATVCGFACDTRTGTTFNIR